MREKRKDILVFCISLITILILFSICLCVKGDDTTGNSYGGGGSWNYTPGQNYYITGEGTGTVVTVYVNGDASDPTYYKPGEGVDGTVYQGYQYATTDPNAPYPPPTGSYDTSREDVAKLLEAMGYDSAICDAVRNGTNDSVITVKIEPYVAIKNDAGEVVRVPVTEAKKTYGSDWNIGNYIDTVLRRLQEENPELYSAILANPDGMGQVIHQILVEETSSPVPTSTSTPGTAEPGTPTPSAPTPTPTPTPVKPDESYTLMYAGPRNCYTNSVNTVAKIDNTIFNVAAGNPIPTSEELYLSGDTNWIANLTGIQSWVLRCDSAQGKTVSAKYGTGYYLITPKSWEQDENGKWGWKRGEQYISATVPSSSPTYRYSSTEIEDIYSMTIDSTKLIKKTTTPYRYIGDARIEDSSTVVVKNTAIGGEVSSSISSGMTLSLNKTINSKGEATDTSRVTIYDDHRLSKRYDSLNEAIDAVKAYKDNPDIDDYFKVESDGEVIVTANGRSKDYGCNTDICTNDFYFDRIKFYSLLINKIPLIPNKSVGNSEYVTEYAKHIVGSRSVDISNVNGVKVHTPIHDELTIVSDSKNQLNNMNLTRNSYKLVTIDDKFKVTLKLDGSTYYYSGIPYVYDNVKKYVKKVELYCGVCGTNVVQEQNNIKREYTHECWVNPEKVTDINWYPITSKVWVENHACGGADKTENAIYNSPDDYYILEQESGITVLGKIYDLQVRATDDPAWKLKEAEKLAKLPTGENGDNKVTTYKNGIKLGYRAYFDLKTLGSASDKISIIPKIYYVDLNGNDLTNTVDLYYRTSATEYKKLSDNDITINMNMNNTRGSDFNSLFKEECSKMLAVFTGIDYNKQLNIGGLKEILLSANNSTRTKYKFKDSVKSGKIEGYIDIPVKNSRRWYGEVYVPSSTVVAEKGATVTEIARGVKTKKTGYLIVVFENIDSQTLEGYNYLRYSVGRDTNGTQFSPVGTNLVSPSIMYNEKTNDGAQALKKTIKLPNGKTFSSYPQTDAPVIIYDVSLRANNDYEQTGTH